MRLDNSPEPLGLPRKAPMRVPENPALLLFGRGSRFGEALARHAGFVAAHGLSGRRSKEREWGVTSKPLI
jgi:hypothetical protein